MDTANSKTGTTDRMRTTDRKANTTERKMEGYPIGQQDFSKIRESNCIYVDKTMYIERILRQKSQYLFLARPRRFGKSLFLSTLRYFFEGRRELFKGLYIDSYAWGWKEYPVLYLDLNPLQYEETGLLDSHLDNCFQIWEDRYGVEFHSDNLSIRFRNIIAAAHKKTGGEVVILIDEYDKPLVGNLNDEGLFGHYRTRLSSIYSNLKSSAEHIKLAFLTGVSRFSKLSVFSDLNNLNDITFDDEYADICGITEQQLFDYFTEGIRKLAETEDVSYEEACGLLKVNYDGYRFARNGSDIYNPWSVLCCMEKSRIGSYWSATGIPKLIAESLLLSEADLEENLNAECDLDTLQGLDLKSPDSLALLYQTGYLTIKSYDKETQLYRLGLPNKEVSNGLFKFLLPLYMSTAGIKPEIVVSDIIKHMRRGEPQKMMESIDVFLAGIPYDMKMEDENNFHNALYILLKLIGAQVDTEVRTSDGRIDLVVQTSRFIYIIELKFDSDPQTAIRQIEEKQYALPYLRDTRRIFCIGANFNPVTRRLDAPEITEWP